MTSSGRETRAPQRLGASPSKQGLSVGDIDIDAEYSAPKMGGVSSGGRTAVTKPLFSQGDRVYASWWQEDSDRCSSPLSWYPGIINNSVTVESSDGHIVPTGCYSVTFDDGDEIDDLEEAHIMGREDFLLKMKQELKPKFEKGDEVYAAWWPDDKRTACTPSWYPGKIKRYREEKNGDSEYGPTRFYDVEFEDGDELGSIEDAYIFKREDYLLTGQAKWLGVKNVVDEDSHDLWANLVGYYTANIDGEEQHFTFLSDALRAYDAHVMDGSGGKKNKKSELNLPEEWVQSASTQGAPRKPKSGQRSSPRINAAILSRIQVGSRVHVKYPRDGSLYNATVKKLMMEKDPPMVKVHYDGRKKKSFHDISPSLIKGFIEGENFSVDQDVKAEETSTDPTLETSSRPHSKPGKSSITNIAKVDQDVDTEKSSAEPTIMASPAPPSKPSPSVASISAENVSLLFELAHSSMSREEAEFEADESIRNPILYLLKKSNTILKEALELYKEKNGVTAASRNPKPEIFEEYQVRVPSLFSLHEASSQDEVKCLASGQGKTLSPDPLVSSCDLDVDVCDNSTRVSDLSCAPIEKEAQNECSLSLADETDVDQMLSSGLPETSADATAEGCDLATKASGSSSSSSHVARNEPESEINSSVHANNSIARISQKETKAQEYQGEIKVKVTVLNELIGVGMIASIASSAPSVNESKSPNSKGKEHATSKRSRSTTEGELTEVSKATQSSTTAKSTQSLPSYKGRGEIDRCVDHGKTSPSPKKRKHENCNGEKRVPNVSADDDAAATSIQAHLGDLQSEAEGNSRGPLTAGNKNGVKVRVRVTVSNIQIGEELAATIAKQDVFAIIKKRFASHPEIYRKFLEILHTYQKEPRGTKEVVDEVSLLFADHADLLEEFTYFLPDSVQSQVKAQLNVMAKKAEDRMRVRQEQAAMERKQDAAGMMGVGGRGGVGVGVGGSASPLVGGRGGAMLLPPAPPAPSSTTGGAGTSSINARKNPNMHGRDIAKSVHPLANTRSTQNEAGVELGENQQPSLQPQTEYNDLTKIMEEYNASMFSMHGFSAQVSHQSALAARVEWQGHIQPAYLPPTNELEHGNNQQSFLQPQTEGMDDLADACAFAAEQLVDSMTDQGAQQPKEAATRLPESYTYQQLSSTMVIPPPDIRTVVDGTALFVSKNGRAFEAKILNSVNGKTPKFAFLHSSSPFHEYYEDRIKFYNEGGTEGNGLHRLLEASNLHSNYYPGHPQLYSAPPQQAWPINTTQQAMLGYHGQFPSPAQPMLNPHFMASPSAVFHQHGMSPNWRPSV